MLGLAGGLAGCLCLPGVEYLHHTTWYRNNGLMTPFTGSSFVSRRRSAVSCHAKGPACPRERHYFIRNSSPPVLASSVPGGGNLWVTFSIRFPHVRDAAMRSDPPHVVRSTWCTVHVRFGFSFLIRYLCVFFSCFVSVSRLCAHEKHLGGGVLIVTCARFPY